MNKKIAFPELVELLASTTNSSKRLSELFLKELFATISQALIDGESVKVKGLGTFKLTKVSVRKSVDVNTGEEIEIPSHNKLSFIPDKELADEINKPFAQFETTVLSDGVTNEELAAVDEQETAPAEEVAAQAAPDGDDEAAAADGKTEAEKAEESATEEAEEPGETEKLETPPPFVLPATEEPAAADAEAESQEAAEAADDIEAEKTEESEQTAEEPEQEAAPESSGEQAEEPADAQSVNADDAENEAESSCEESGTVLGDDSGENENGNDAEEQNDIVLPADYHRMEFDKKLKEETRRSLLRGFLWGVLVGVFACGVACYLLYTVSIKTDYVPDAEVIVDTLASDDSVAATAAVPAAAAEKKDTAAVTGKKEALTTESGAQPQKTKTVTETVDGKTLMGLSTKHYGKWCFWVYIYEENKDKIGNPNNMKPGTVLVIPPAEKYGIDAHDKESVQKAKAKSTEILKRYERKQKTADEY